MVFSFPLASDYMEKIVIIGGGVAGLSCLNALLDKGHSPLLLEAASIGTPKMCGEFLAPTAIQLLNKWNIHLIHEIHQTIFHASSQKLIVNFSVPAGAIARASVELALANRAQKLNGRIQENCAIKNITPMNSYTSHRIHLNSGEEIQANTIMLATGKFNQRKDINFPYIGIKLHIPFVFKKNTLLMHSIKNGYFGIVPITNEMSNLTCLVKRNAIVGSGKEYLYHKLGEFPYLKSIQHLIDIENLNWLEAPSPEFGIKKLPNWQNTFWIGDAAASLHPAIGSGFTHAIQTSVSAAKYYENNTSNNYRHFSKKVMQKKLFLAKLLHSALFHPKIGVFVIKLFKNKKWITEFLMRKLDYF
jgi:flavin-dependent dehydrogenase